MVHNFIIPGAIGIAVAMWLTGERPETRPPAGPTYGTIGDTGGFGCPYKGDIEQIRQMITTQGSGSIGWMIWADHACERFRTGERVVIEVKHRNDAMYVARRPDSPARLWFAQGSIEPDRTP